MEPNPNALTALAMLKANWDQYGRSYLESVFPFISAVLSKLDNESADVSQIRESLEDEFGLRLPFSTVENLLNRGCASGIYRKNGQPSERNFSILSPDEGIELWKRRSKILRQQEVLLTNFMKFASEELGEALSEAEAQERLLRQVERASVPVLKNWLWGGQFSEDSGINEDSDYVTSKFILHLYRNDAKGFSDLEDIVQGNMLASALYYVPKLRFPAERFRKIYVILDTRILFRALGYEGLAEKEVSLEMLRLAAELDAQLVCFKRTIQEMKGVLTAVEKSLTPGNRSASEGGPVRRHFLSEMATPSDIRLRSSKLEADLRSIRVRVIEKPQYSGPLAVNEERLEDVLRERVHYRNDDAMLHDLDVLTAVFRLRAGEVQPSLEDCKAIFITSNDQVVRACRTFFQDEGISESRWPLALADHAFATILWLKRPLEAPDLPRNQLIANSYAGLVPSVPLWQKVLSELDKLVKRGDDAEDAYNRLRYDFDAERLLMVHTLGDVNRFNEGTIYDIIEDIHRGEWQDSKRDEQSSIRGSEINRDAAPGLEIKETGSEEVQSPESQDSATALELKNLYSRLDSLAERRANSCIVLIGCLTLMAICSALWVGLPSPIAPSLDAIPEGFAVAIKTLAVIGAFTLLAGILFGFTVGGSMKVGRNRLKRWLLGKWLGRDQDEVR